MVHAADESSSSRLTSPFSPYRCGDCFDLSSGAGRKLGDLRRSSFSVVTLADLRGVPEFIPWKVFESEETSSFTFPPLSSPYTLGDDGR